MDAEPRRVMLVTGAGGLLGRALCQRVTATCDVVAVIRSRSPQAVSQHARLVDPLAPHDGVAENEHPIHVVRADITDEDDVARVVEVALARFGRIDCVVNSAALMGRSPVLDERAFLPSLHRHLNVNVVAQARVALAVTRGFWQHDPAGNRAHNRNLINVSSTAGLFVYAGIGQAPYSISKAALNFLTLHLAEELAAFDVRANAVAPTTFPGLVSLDRVVDAIVRLDEGSTTASILAVEGDEDVLY